MKTSYRIVCVIISLFLLSLVGWGLQETSFAQQAPQFSEPPEELPGDQRVLQKEPGKKRPDDVDDDGGIRINWRALRLTAEQLEQITQHRRNFQVSTAGLRQELQFAQQDLQEAIQMETVDRAKIDQLLTQYSSLKQRLNEAAIQNILAMKSVLTQEQLNLLDQQQARLPRELQRLQLNAEQQTQIRAIMKESFKTSREIEMALQTLKLDLREMLLSSEEIDSEQLKHVQAAIAEKELALEKTHVERLLQMRKLLTPEQIERYKKIQQKRPDLPPARP